jgi:hypothetical protein
MSADRSQRVTFNRTSSRRDFLKAAAVGGAAVLAAPAILRGRNLNERLNIAIIGSGGRGGANLRSVASENIVALCDVNANSLAQAAKAHPDAKQFEDFRKLYDESGTFDAVVVSTCEHTHAFATLPGLQLGKHVYCEKPLTHNVWEARVIREAANKAKVATQMGTQVHASDNYRRVVELIQSGAVGNVREAHVWVSRAWGRQSKADAEKNKDIVYAEERPATADPVPENLNWDLWLGPAPERPFNNVYYPGPKWYRWWDFGNGTMSDLGSHWIDLPFWALKLDHPLTIEAQRPEPHAEIAPASMQVTYTYGQRGELPPLSLTWYQGVNKPRIWTDGGIPNWGNGVLFVGDGGKMLLADYGKHVLLPEKEFVDYQRPEPFLPKSLGHHAEWIRACKTGEATTCNFEYAGWLTEANHLGNVAFRAGKKLEWDAANLRATNAPEAAPFIRREYRPGWKLI